MSGSRLVGVLILAVLSMILVPNTALAQQSQLREVPGAQVTVRVDSGWSYNLALWRDYSLNEFGDYQFERFILRGWATDPDLNSFPIDLILPSDYWADRHSDWLRDDNTLLASDPVNGDQFRTDLWRGDVATVAINQDEAKLVVSVSTEYRAALTNLTGFEIGLNDIVNWYALASVFAGSGSVIVSNLQECETSATNICGQVCPSPPGNPHPNVQRKCIRTFSFNSQTGECSYSCYTYADCCANSTNPTP